jgi:hypothetical protein
MGGFSPHEDPPVNRIHPGISRYHPSRKRPNDDLTARTRTCEYIASLTLAIPHRRTSTITQVKKNPVECPQCHKLIGRKADLPRHLRLHASPERKLALYVARFEPSGVRLILFIIECISAHLTDANIVIFSAPTSRRTQGHSQYFYCNRSDFTSDQPYRSQHRGQDSEMSLLRLHDV